MIKRALKLFAVLSFCSCIVLLKLLFASNSESGINVVVYNNCSCSTCTYQLPVPATEYRREITTTSNTLPSTEQAVILNFNSVTGRSDFNWNSSQIRTVQNCITREIIGSWQPSTRQLNSVKSIKSKYRETSEDRLTSFVKVYSSHAWGFGWDDQDGNKNSGIIGASGRGASIKWTQEIMVALHNAVNEIKQALNKKRLNILDVPCGDMVWMSRFLSTRDDIDYTGIDIVPALIEHHKKAYGSPERTFIAGDILTLPLNKTYDLIVCRTLLQHLYYVDVLRALRKFSNSGSSYILMTTFAAHDENVELELGSSDNPGRFRPLNVEIPPVSLTPPLCLTRDGPPDISESWQQYFGLWQLPLYQVSSCRLGWQLKLPSMPNPLYSCIKWDVHE